ncbi:SRPBCC family protein [Marinobacter qingdaonensis]|uniref:SRPBCC family protein n=1 Tax=Marinobacter qingdaonensis TaxID=3108486 RepID=A0ABU5NYL0_9GAMM|nr:SRPBCC family protein [Marinobacter sp. ASW11-75]MCS5563940.1 SRPBCC family protein [Oleiphilaceae bacterium]MEA1080878.1 SRPBCC family protein [Marinobacter sp. ASW11-75]MEE2764061.1 SRPBCC family protein [Pseudomonadota bacterium]MEE3117814.1 SRPBCC family protein [Pseudomonadota bacterium]
MAITVSIELNRELELPAGYDEVFELLADVPRSASHFPKVHKLEDLGDNTYRWEMEKVGVDKHAIQSIYACKYQSDKEAGRITWEPVKGEGNGVVRGSWTLKAKGDSVTVAKFQTSAELTVPLPSLLKLAISPVIKHEFNSLVDTYMNNLKKAV